MSGQEKRIYPPDIIITYLICCVDPYCYFTGLPSGSASGGYNQPSSRFIQKRVRWQITADHTAAAPADLSIDALETMFQKGRILNRMEHTSDARNLALFSILDTPIVKLASTSFHICEFDVIQWTNRTDHWKLIPLIWPNDPLLAEPIKTV